MDGVDRVISGLQQLSTTGLLVIVLSSIFYYYFTSTFDFWSKRGVPFRKPTIILGNFGDLLLFRKSQPEGISDIYNWFKEARFIGVYRVRSPILILRDPELVKHVCVKDFTCFTNRGIPVNNVDSLSGHLFNAEGKAWKGLRSKLTPAFSSAKIKRMFYLLVECQEELRKLIVDTSRIHEATDEGVEVRELAAKFTIDVIGSCAFGIHVNALSNDDSAFRRMASRLSRPGYKATLWRMLRTALPTVYRILGVQVIDPEVTRFFKDVVSQMIEQRENETGDKRHDFMDLLVELKNKGSLDVDNGSNVQGSSQDEERQATRDIGRYDGRR